MAKAGRATIKVNYTQVVRKMEVVLKKVQRGTRKATIAAAQEILAESLKQVPRETTTLASSAFVKIIGRSPNFEAIIGYGGNGDPVNPKTGERASKYMVVVHEDLDAKHPIGKAKYLEDPIREYQQKFGPRYVSILRGEIGM